MDPFGTFNLISKQNANRKSLGLSDIAISLLFHLLFYICTFVFDLASGGVFFYFHHGARPVLKSVSVHRVSTTFSSTTFTLAKANERGAGPRITLPVESYCDPWHGHMNLFAARFHGTTHPRCVHTAFNAYFSSVSSSCTIR